MDILESVVRDEQDGGDVGEKGEERGERVNLSCGAQRRLCPETEI